MEKLKRRKTIKKELELQEMSKHKIKICIDENIKGNIETLLENKGYNVVKYKKGLSDSELNSLLNKNNVKFFFTYNYKDFINFNRNYVLFGFTINRPNDILSDIIEWLIMNFNKQEKLGYFNIITNELLKNIGCKK